MGTGITKGLKTVGKKIAAGVAGVELPGDAPAANRSSGWETTIGGLGVVAAGVWLVTSGEREIGIGLALAGVTLMRTPSNDTLLSTVLEIFGRRKP